MITDYGQGEGGEKYDRADGHSPAWVYIVYMWRSYPCELNEPALQPPPQGALARIALFMSVPVLPGVSELACMD